MTEKTCTKCLESKSLTNFRVRNKIKNTYSPWCKSCFSSHERETWQNSSQRRQSTKKRNNDALERNRNHVWNYLSTHPCIECNECDPIVLEFDHIDRDDKLRNISDLISRKVSIQTLDTEISKCRVLCANCHRRHTHKQMGWWSG